MIKMVSVGGLYCPCAFCDYCGLRIKNEGILVWNHEALDNVRMIHKGECDRKHNSLHGEFGLSRELTTTVEHLAYNISQK